LGQLLRFHFSFCMSSTQPKPLANQQIFKEGYLDELLKKIDPNEKLDEHSEKFLNILGIDFVRLLLKDAGQFAKKRGAETVAPSDIYYVLETNFNMTLPGATGKNVYDTRPNKPTNDYLEKLSAVKSFLNKRNED